MIYFILFIVLLTIILYFLYKDYLKVLKISSIVSVISGLLTFVVGYVIKFLIDSNVDFINITKVSSIILSKFIKNGLYLILLGFIETSLYFIIKVMVLREK